MFWLSKGNFNYQTVFHHTIRLYYYKSRINHKNHFESMMLMLIYFVRSFGQSMLITNFIKNAGNALISKLFICYIL